MERSFSAAIFLAWDSGLALFAARWGNWQDCLAMLKAFPLGARQQLRWAKPESAGQRYDERRSRIGFAALQPVDGGGFKPRSSGQLSLGPVPLDAQPGYHKSQCLSECPGLALQFVADRAGHAYMIGD